jgi:hypothetical protein
MSIEVTMTPLSDRGNRLLDALEARTDTRPYRVSADTGARTYSLESESAGIDFEKLLDRIDPNWNEHLTGTGS